MEHLSQAIDLSSPGTIEAVTCPACGLLCDDLSVERHADGALKVIKNPCAKGVKFFQYTPKTTQPRIAGKPSDLQAAIAKATEILGGAKHPLLSGLGTDIQGMRAVMNLAEKSGATIDHMNGKSSMRNLLVMQNSGWQITTLTEVKNRVDLLLVVGTDIVSYFSRLNATSGIRKPCLARTPPAAKWFISVVATSIPAMAYRPKAYSPRYCPVM